MADLNVKDLCIELLDLVRSLVNILSIMLMGTMTVGFLYGAGAETLIFVTGTSGKYPKLFVSRQKNQSQLWIPQKPRKIGVWVSGAEIQTSAVDTRTAVWVSTPEKFSKIVLGKNSKFFSNVRGVSAPALYKNPAVRQSPANASSPFPKDLHDSPSTFQGGPGADPEPETGTLSDGSGFAQ